LFVEISKIHLKWGWAWEVGDGRTFSFPNMSRKLDDKTYFFARSKFFLNIFFSKINKGQTLEVGQTNG
jgi:hypothetical protein